MGGAVEQWPQVPETRACGEGVDGGDRNQSRGHSLGPGLDRAAELTEG